MVCSNSNGPEPENATSTDEQQQQQKQKDWEKLKKCIHCSMVAFGSDTVPLYKLVNAFRSEWSKYGDLLQCATDHGFTGTDPEEAMLAMLKAMPEELECMVQGGQHGQPPIVMVRVASKEQTKEVVKLIDVSNQHKSEKHMQRAEQHSRHRFGSSSSSFRAVPPLRSSYSSSFGVTSAVMPQNPNLIPLGPRRSNVLNITAAEPLSTDTESSNSSKSPSKEPSSSSSVTRPFSTSAAPIVDVFSHNINNAGRSVPIPDAIAKLNDALSIGIRRRQRTRTNSSNNSNENSSSDGRELQQQQKDDQQRQKRAEFAKRTSTTLGWTDDFGRRLGLPIPATTTNKTTTAASKINNSGNNWSNKPKQQQQTEQQYRQQYQKWYNQKQQPPQQKPQKQQPCPEPVKKMNPGSVPHRQAQIATVTTANKVVMMDERQQQQNENAEPKKKSVVIDKRRDSAPLLLLPPSLPPLAVPQNQQYRDNIAGGSLQGTDEEEPSSPDTASSDNDALEAIVVPAEVETIVPKAISTDVLDVIQNCGKCELQKHRISGGRIDIDQWMRDYQEMLVRFARLNLIDKMEDKSMTVW